MIILTATILVILTHALSGGYDDIKWHSIIDLFLAGLMELIFYDSVVYYCILGKL